MKKIISLLVVFGVALSLGGCFKKAGYINQDDSKAKQYSSLMSWLKSGKGVKCVVETPQGEIIISAKDDKTRIDGIAFADMTNPASAGETQPGVSLTDAEWIYMWGGKSGIKMNIDEMNKTSEEMGSNDRIDPEDYSWESWVSDQEETGMNYNCHEEKLSDDIFQAPSDVEFRDLGEMMKGLGDLSNGLTDSFGGNGDVPSFEGSQAMSQEDIEQRLEEMMKDAGIE